MKVAVFSDTHGVTQPMVDAVRETAPDALIHLGDYERDAEVLLREFPGIPLYRVCGNCDYSPKAPNCLTVKLGPVTAFLTHGHLYHVDFGRIDSLVYAAQEAGAQLALYGHTHTALHKDLGGVKVINPGTAGKGREKTWAMLEIFENGGIAAEIRTFPSPADRKGL